ncbi:MAG TPA: lamin tail domain-containing protein [Feifaniaceae bacterium]|nr:lamin tail domain-containing protein [Feifaniaceae bacterium]
MNLKRVPLLFFVVLLCAAGLFVVFKFSGSTPGGGAAAGGTVRINEVMTSNKGAVPDENGDFPDWIELYNSAGVPADISGYGLTDDMLAAAKWAFPSGTVIPANGYLVVFCSGNALDGPLHASFKLSASDQLIFSNATGRPIDSMELKSAAAGTALMRAADGSWQETALLSPGFPNTEEGAAQYRETLQVNTVDNGVRINEFMASNATTLPGPQGDYPDWVELYNTTGQEADISGCGLSDEENQPMKWVFPEGTKIPANGVLLIYCSGRDGLIDGVLNAPFSLRAYAESVVFSDRKGGIIDSFAYTEQQADISMARVPDGTGEFQPMAQPTPGYPNTEDGFAAFNSTSALPTGALLLSEVMGNNAGSYTENNATPDWIELYNSSSEPVNLSGYALSDNPNNPALWRFPDVTIAPNSYYVVLATGNDVKDTQKKTLETNFSLSAAGDVVLLYSPEGELLDKLQLGKTGADVSLGRSNGKLLYYASPTPGAANGQGSLGITAVPAFSMVPGVYEGAIALELSAKANETIYYTTDSTAPTQNSTRYTGPIPLEHNTVVRAVSVRDGYITGSAATGTFLFTGDDVNHTLPILTLVTDPKNLWDEKTGIYAYGENYDPDLPYGDALLSSNFYKGKGTDGEEAQSQWERPANFAVFGDDRRQAFSQDVAVRIAGGYGRGRAQKGFNILARSEYGNNTLDYAFFENRPYTSYKSLSLRAGAQDQNRSKIRDELSSGLLEGTDVNVLVQAYKPYVMYLNGEYWGVYFMKEKRSRFFVAQHENTEDADNMDIMKSSSLLSHGSKAEWAALMDYVNSHDLSSREHYRYVADRMDVESFMDYMICELYVANTDYANIQYYKLPGGKWKWIYYDFCWGWNNYNHTTVTNRRGSVPAASGLFNALLKNADWKDAFCRRFAQIMDTVYAPDRVIALIDELAATVDGEIAREREKFNGATFRDMPQHDENLGSYKSFQSNIAYLKEFAQKRPDVIKAQLQQELGLSDAYMKEVFS